MRVSTEGGRVRFWALLAALVLVLVATVAACGGDDDDEGQATATTGTGGGETGGEATGEPIKIGVFANNEGAFAPFEGQTFGGAMLPLINRGATPVSGDPTDGVENATIAGHPIEIVYGGSDSTPDKAVEEARRLVEQEGVDILVGPLSGSEGIAVANYSKEQPGVTFVNGISGAQDTTLKVRSPNFFRFHNDGTQWTAGLGDYAYNELGWRNVVTIGDDYDFPYSQIAGFVAEFCSIGGNVTKRLWPPLGEEDYSSYITQIPEDVDGFFMGVGGTGTVAFVKQYEQLRGNLADKIMGGIFMTDPVILKELGDQVVGVVTAGMTSGDSQEPALPRVHAADRRLPIRISPERARACSSTATTRPWRQSRRGSSRSTATFRTTTRPSMTRWRTSSSTPRSGRSSSMRTARRSWTTSSSRSSRTRTATASPT